MSSGSILYSEWSQHCPNKRLSPEFCHEGGKLEITSGMNGYLFGYCETPVEALPGAYYCLEVEMSVEGIADVLRHVLCLVEWGQGREEHLRCAQEIMSEFTVQDETIHGRLVCRVPHDALYAKVQLGLRYAANSKIVFSRVTWNQVSPQKPRSAKIGVCRWNPAKSGGKVAYLTQLARLLKGAGEAGCDLMLLPEFCDVYEWKENLLFDDPLTENIAVCMAMTHAQKHQMYVVAPVIERDGDCVYNTSVLLDRDGKLAGKYRKTHLYWPEACCWGLTPGNEFPVFTLDFGKIGIQTCYDNWNPDVAKLLALKGAELILMPNEGYDPLIMPARAVDNRVYLALSSLAFESAVYDAKGEKIGKDEGAIHTAVIDLNARIPPYPVAGGSCNYAMGARRSVHNSLSDQVYRELQSEVNRWQGVNESFVDMRSDACGDLSR